MRAASPLHASLETIKPFALCMLHAPLDRCGLRALIPVPSLLLPLPSHDLVRLNAPLHGGACLRRALLTGRGGPLALRSCSSTMRRRTRPVRPWTSMSVRCLAPGCAQPGPFQALASCMAPHPLSTLMSARVPDSGSFCDPEELPGLAHFLEHMLFLGTEKVWAPTATHASTCSRRPDTAPARLITPNPNPNPACVPAFTPSSCPLQYPRENEYSQFLTEHGGGANAFTSQEHTNYHLEIAHDHLHGALDRFAQFFISPLFSQDCTERELKAVDSGTHRDYITTTNCTSHPPTPPSLLFSSSLLPSSLPPLSLPPSLRKQK